MRSGNDIPTGNEMSLGLIVSTDLARLRAGVRAVRPSSPSFIWVIFDI